MDRFLYEKLQKDLAIAVREKDYEKISELRRMLDISDEQARYFEKGLTGYPTVDRPWLNYYEEDTEERVNNIPENSTIWDVIEGKLEEYYDIPALEYFGKTFSRPKFIELCYVWARTFRALGVESNEVVPIYGPFVPDVCAMLLGLNMIGACPYFLKLAIGPKDLAEETKEAKIAVVFDKMWPYVGYEFSKDKFKYVVVASATDDMPSPKKEVVSFINKIQSRKNKSPIPDENKYIWADRAKRIANYYTGEVKVPFEKGRRAIITSSSGTTGGIKGTVATNESVLTQVFSTTYSDILYRPGFRTLNHFPPTAATSLNALFLVGLLNGATVIIDPRVSEKDFYNQLVNLQPNICINTGSLWKTFFNRVAEEMKKGKKFDFGYAKGWMIGGEGASSKQMHEWDNIMKRLGGGRIIGGYGLSETFSGISYDRIDEVANYSRPIMNSGLIQAGMTVGVYDKDGKELSYNQRGELKVSTNAMMQGYYGKPELTAKSVVDGRVETGDLAEIDEKGFLYVWGRMSDKVTLSNGEDVYLFDVANKIKENEFIDDAMVLLMPTDENSNNLVAHIVWNKNILSQDKKKYIELLNSQLEEYLPSGVTLSAYSVHDKMLPYSPTTLKIDRVNVLSKQTEGYVQVVDGVMYNVTYNPSDNGKYLPKYALISQDKTKKLKRK